MDTGLSLNTIQASCTTYIPMSRQPPPPMAMFFTRSTSEMGTQKLTNTRRGSPMAPAASSSLTFWYAGNHLLQTACTKNVTVRLNIETISYIFF
ncbi:hypothetical protein DPMN_178823 [Dreissena polymorpha]|uniref:Uncharacterized protein n=1 Tax=Dreissena polymorpha TaxID=45954 RepID=A0A9D4EB69_DREPO|nr:hypothetical protein DPMN_178712 [Dreissena polymorpha]KAH3777309.1 hypothetical protein DPMN_178749 [Dreissena polymorpha]KAH3777382.1 hypothetical protein DPMN_178823 [Dreissena polymorpha]